MRNSLALALASTLAAPLTLAFQLGLAPPNLPGQETVQLVPQLGMSDVRSVVYSPDGHLVLIASGNSARLCDPATGRQIRSFTGHTGNISSVAFSPDGRSALSGSEDHSARLWDVSTGKQLRSFTAFGEIRSVAFTPDGQYVLGAAEEHTTYMWESATGKLIHSLSSSNMYDLAVAVSPDGKSVLTGNLNNTAHLWDRATGREIRQFRESPKPPEHPLPANGRYLPLLRPTREPPRWISSVAFSPDGRTVLLGNEDGTARQWDIATGTEIRMFGPPHFTGSSLANSVQSAAFSSDGRYVLIGTIDGYAEMFDAQTGEKARVFSGPNTSAKVAAFSPDGRYVLAGGDHLAALWDASTGEVLHTFQGQTSKVWTVAFSADSRYMLTGGEDNAAHLWDLGTGVQVRTFNGPGLLWVTSARFSADGKTVTAGDGKDMSTWDAASGNELKSARGADASVPDAAEGPQTQNFKTELDDDVYSSEASPDGRFVATGHIHNEARLWDAATGKQLGTFIGHSGPVSAIAFSPSSSRILTGSWDHTARIWDINTRKTLHVLEGHTDWIEGVAFSPDNRFILTGSFDTTSRLWDANTGNLLATLLTFPDGGWAVVDPLGRFDTNDLDGGAPLAWVASSDPLRALPLEVFMRDYYTPRLLASIVNRETLQPIRPISEITNRVQPDVEIVSVQPSAAMPGRADVVVHAASRTDSKSQSSGLQDLRLFRNGQLVGYRPDKLNDGDFTFADIQLPTSAQKVTFTTYALNSLNIKSATASKEYTYAPISPARPRAWLLQIGADHYQADGCELHNAASDAAKLGRVLIERIAALGLQVQAVQLVSTDSEQSATKEKIRLALASIATHASPDDVFFLSFSGHGYGAPDGQFYILPSDIHGSCSDPNPALLAGAISADELAEWLSPIDAGEMTFILDSCDSASSVEANGFKPGPMGSRGLGQLAYDKRMRILAASQPNQAARESDTLHQGLLTYALAQQGLIEGRADWKPLDQKVTVGEWLAFAANAVPGILESGGVKADRGFLKVAKPDPNVKPTQLPAVFDFSKQDNFILQVIPPPTAPHP
jgi:WD40 repeat protein